MKRLLASCFGLGRLPIAPGTWGSLPPMAIFILLYHLNLPMPLTAVVMIVLALAASVVCVICAPEIITATGKSDPREIVADEVAGQAVTFLIISILAACTVTNHIYGTALLGFFIFRLFDVIKPWPVRNLEKLSKGWGVLADDLLAGAYAGITSVICLKLWICRAGG